MDARVLAQVLRGLPSIEDPDVLVGTSTTDDAGVYRISDDLAIVQSVDFFTPIVDEPRAFGRIAAANALSDIYAMGAKPVTATALAAFPAVGLDIGVLTQILAGGVEKAREAGIDVIGGHTIKDDEPKYGLCVTGLVHPERILRNSTGRAGDALVLTKPLGTGILTTARRRDVIREVDLREAIESMERLNAAAGEAAVRFKVHAVTDVTGFGLLGHLREMTQASGVGARVRSSAVPLLERTLQLSQQGCVPSGTRDNLQAAIVSGTRFQSVVSEPVRLALCDAQTSGGLLVAVDAQDAGEFVETVSQNGDARAAIVGSLTNDYAIDVY
ncbi:MAG: selenide, water dikinase SelD [Candidatus Eremiobacteraeota bacterium]|nr:selenide, water dikinase SelD [Candidatus Eremiobacteraeota bacterium]MBC5826986.1 selenide, water dikinase SelD [Candidatus Eremiobacteraeota bacterium]